jgi:hypothetical protein
MFVSTRDENPMGLYLQDGTLSKDKEKLPSSILATDILIHLSTP